MQDYGPFLMWDKPYTARKRLMDRTSRVRSFRLAFGQGLNVGCKIITRIERLTRVVWAVEGFSSRK